MHGRIDVPIYVIFLLLVMMGCEDSNQSSSSNNSSQKEASNTINPDFLKEHFPVLDSITRSKNSLHESLNTYAQNLVNAGNRIKNGDDLEALFKMRDVDIIKSLHKDVLDPIALNDGVFYHSPAGAKLDKELNDLGLQAIYAEGMYLDLGPGAMLEKEMEQYASEVFKLYMDFQSAKTTSMMGEYPYLNLEGERAMVAIGEKIRTNHPDHEYAKAIEEDFWNALMPFTDVHMVKSEFDKSYITYELSKDFYPYATNVDSLKNFLTAYPDSKYKPVVTAILDNMSEMESTKGTWKDLHVVVVSWEKATTSNEASTCDAARKIRNEFIDKGIDISTVLKLNRNKIDECALVYRFFADKRKAEDAQKTVKSKVEEVAGLVTLQFNPVEKTWNLK